MRTTSWNRRHVRMDKDSSLREQGTSYKWQREDGQQDQRRDQLLPDNDTRVWTVDEGKIPCEGQQG